MLTLKHIGFYSLLMTLVVVLSNFLVQFPLPGTVAGIHLGDLLTFGAFTYPVAFLVNDLTNRQFGAKTARLVVFIGFITGLVLSYITSQPRIAMASGSAFLLGQLLDITVFSRLRQKTWWKAPLAGTVFGSIMDTSLFFSLSFAPVFAFLGPNDDFAIAWAPLLGVFSPEIPRWISWAICDFSVKLLVGIVMLLPYGALMHVLRPVKNTTELA